MSSLSFMEKLLDGAEVEWKPLGDERFVDISNSGRKPVEASLRVSGTNPYYGANNIQDYVDGYTHDGDFVLIAEDGSASLERYSIQYATGKFWANNHVHVVRGKQVLNTRYLYHYLCTVNFLPFLTGGGRAKLTKGSMVQVPIPIPYPEDPDQSLDIQAKIVRILDNFAELTSQLTSQLTSELTSELSNRKKQYNYYRDQLLRFEEGEVKLKALGEIGEILRGTAITEKETTPGEFPVVGNGPTHNYFHDKSNRDGETIVIARSGAYAGLVSYWNQPIFLTDAFSIHPDTTLLKTRFLYHVLKRDQSKIHYMGQGAGVPHVRAKDFESYKVPVPPLAEQARIVAILDRFDALTYSISEGLPREIELRQKQYEHYRDLLFSFPKPEVAA